MTTRWCHQRTVLARVVTKMWRNRLLVSVLVSLQLIFLVHQSEKLRPNAETLLKTWKHFFLRRNKHSFW